MRTPVCVLFVFSYLLSALLASADRASFPAEATVFVRVSGKITLVHRGLWIEVFSDDKAEIAVGSGFVISPSGHILTNHHLIEGKEVTVFVDDEPYEVSMDVQTVDIAFPAEIGLESLEEIGPDELKAFFPATIEATDPDLDLALLHISGSDLPYIALGDSDAVEPGQEVEILGYPLGWEANLGRSSLKDAVPQVSVNPGSLSAVRYGDDNRARYLQTDAAANPGNSGGPMVDEDGYALGVFRLISMRGSRVNYSIPINRVKEFLESQGYDWIFPTDRFELGPWNGLPGKGVQIRLPVGFADHAPTRLRIECTGPSNDVALLIDRVVSPWSSRKLEQSLLAGGLWEPSTTMESIRRRHGRKGRSSVLLGHATGFDPAHNQFVKMEYAIFDLEKEKLVARYVGPASTVAFNLGVLRASLESLRPEPLLTAEVRRAEEVSWTQAPMPHNLGPDGLLPSGWIQEEAGAYHCQGLPQPDSVLAASPQEDFTVSFGLSWWESPAVTAREAAAACSLNAGRFGATSYLYSTMWLGVSHAVEGLFIPVGEGMLQIEIATPVAKRAYMYPAFKDWVRLNRSGLRADQVVRKPE